MSFTFSQEQVDELKPLIQAALAQFQVNSSAAGIFTAAYEAVFDAISVEIDLLPGTHIVPADGVNLNAYRWIEGAKDVNSDTGAFAGFIRSYTELQHQARYGEPMGPNEMQRASNGVASRFFQDVLEKLSRPDPNERVLPTIREIGEADAGAAASVVFGGDYAPWAGTLLFPYLNESYFFKQLLLSSRPFNLPDQPGYQEEKITKIEPGSYDIISAIGLGLIAAQDNGLGLFWNVVTGQTPYVDENYYTNETNQYFQGFYGLTDEEVDDYHFGESLTVKNGLVSSISAQLSTTEFSVGTIHDDAGQNAVVLSGGPRHVLNAGRGDDVVRVEFTTPAQWGVPLGIIADGSDGYDTFDYADSASTGLIATIGEYDGGYYDTRVEVTTEDGVVDHKLYGFEKIILSSNDDILELEQSIHPSIEGMEIDGGDNGEMGDHLDVSSFQSGVEVILDGPDDTAGSISSDGSSLWLANFENVIGSEFDDKITGDGQNNVIKGGGGADELRGEGGDDTLYFDADDTVVDGGEGRDTAIVEGTDGVTLNLTDANVEIAVGGDGDDTFYLSGGQMAAGGEGEDTFHVQEGGEGPTIIYGGGDTDKITGAKNILTVEVAGLTEENFSDFSLDLVDADIDWSQVDVVLLNPGSEDKYYWDDAATEQIKIRSEVYEVATYAYGLDDTNLTIEDIEIPFIVFETITYDTFAPEGEILTGPYDQILYSSVVTETVSFLGSAVTEIQTISATPYYDYYYFYVDSNGEPSLTGRFADDPSLLNDAAFSRPYEIRLGDATKPGVPAIIYFFENKYENDLTSADTVVWYTAGSEFVGDRLVSNGSITATMPNAGASSQAMAEDETNIEPGSGSQSLSGFQVASNSIAISGVVIDPNAPPSGVTVAQQNDDVVIGFGNDETVTLLNVSLADWQAAASGQILGTNVGETLVGTEDDDFISAGAGNDIIDAGNGDDTVLAGAGDDTIDAGRGNDTYATGSGSDTIRVETGDGADTVTDFDVGHDLIEINGVVFNPNVDLAGVTVSELDGDVTIAYGNGDTLTLSDVSLAAWQAASPPAPTVEAADDTASVVEDGSTTIDALANDSATLTLSSVSAASNGTAIIENGQINYTPNANFNGVETLTYTAVDGDGVSRTATVTITVTPENDAPTASEDAASLTAGETVLLDVVANDTDIDGDALTISSVWGASNGMASIVDGQVSYTPNDDFFGTETLTYTVDDGNGGSNTAVITITVLPNLITINGSNTNDTLSGSAQAEYLTGKAGNDTLEGRNGDDVLEGGTGADTLFGGSSGFVALNGNDTYTWSRGDGNDWIGDHASSMDEVDRLVLTDVDSDDVRLIRDNNSTHLKIIVTGDNGEETITVTRRYEAWNKGYGIEEIQFSDGEIWTLNDILLKTTVTGTDGNDVLNGTGTRDNLYGLAGDDVLNGSWHRDILVGGTGDDILRGGGGTINSANGSDKFVWSRGDGNDTIVDFSSSKTETDRLLLTDVASGDVQLTRSNGSDDLTITISGPDGDETITVKSRFETLEKGYGIEEIEFGDGEVWILEDILANTKVNGTNGNDILNGTNTQDNLHGGAGNDTLNGSWNRDVLVGGTGDDTLVGGHGKDQFVFKSGDGDDRITDFEDGNDFLVLEGTGLAYSDLVITDTSGGAVVDLDGQGTITLVGVNSTLITEDDFQFV